MEKQPKERPPKPALRNQKPYAAPVLESWGTLVELTKKVGSRGSPDGGKSKNQNKTRP